MKTGKLNDTRSECLSDAFSRVFRAAAATAATAALVGSCTGKLKITIQQEVKLTKDRAR